MKHPSHPTTVLAAAITCACLALSAPAGANTDPPSNMSSALGHPPTGTPQPTIVRETVASGNTDDLTLPITLAAGALLVAIGGTGYSIAAVTRINRRAAGRSA